jgi:hypothetical protein
MRYGTQNYAFEQNRSRGSVSGNNSTYEALNVRLRHLLPYFENEGYQIHNCTPDSGLTAFPLLSFHEAVEQALDVFPRKIITAGMYDQKAKSNQPPVNFPTTSGWEAVTPEALRKEEELLPATTLVTYVDKGAEGYLPHTWATWRRLHPWLSRLPAVVLHRADHDVTSLRNQLVTLHPEVRFIAADSSDHCRDASSWSYAALRYVVDQIESPWYLMLAPEAVAIRDQRLLDPQWFSQNDSQQPLAFISCPWGYAKPADIFERLDQWGDGVAELARFNRLNIPFDPHSDRVRHPTANTWFLMASTEWSRTAAQYAQDDMSWVAFSTFLVYCAERRGDRFLLHQMKHHGWDHSFRGEKGLAERCRRLLESQAT